MSTAHSALRRLCLALLLLGLCIAAQAKPTVLEKTPIPSPDRSYYANVEWEDVGFIGILRMKIWDRAGQPYRMVELPEINPEAANLVWVDREWVACESFIGNNGSGFFYVHVPSGRGYLLEIVQPRPNADWLFSVASNDAISSESVSTVSRGHSSLFPILLRDAPTREVSYFAPEFTQALSEATDAFNAFRRQRHFRDLELLSDADIRPELGGIVLAEVDGYPLVVYFPANAQTPREMFERVRSQPLPEEARRLLAAADAPEPRVRWLTGGEFVVETAPDDSADKNTSSVKTLMRGRFEDVHDTPQTTATATQQALTQPPPGQKKPGIVVEVKPAEKSSRSSRKKR